MLDKQVAETFRDKGCVVTGSGSGIGLAVSEALLECGAKVFMADVNEKGLASAAENLAAYGGRVHTTTVDVSKEDQVRGLIEDAAAKYSRLDFVFNNAGVGGPWCEVATIEDWRRLIDINLWSVIYGVHYALPIMKRQGSGHIVNTASIGGLFPLPFESIYCTIKHAIVGLSETVRYELADLGIRVSAVCPGGVATAIFQMSEAELAKALPDAIPASEAARWILTGVARNDALIVFPENTIGMWRSYWKSPEAWEPALMAWARERKLNGINWHPGDAFRKAHFPADYFDLTPHRGAQAAS